MTEVELTSRLPIKLESVSIRFDDGGEFFGLIVYTFL